MPAAAMPTWKRIAIVATVVLAITMAAGGFLGPRLRYVSGILMLVSGVVLVLCLALKPAEDS